MYVRIYYTGGFIEWTSISMMKATGFGTNCKEIIISLVLSAEEERPIGIWGQRHKCYLKEYKNATYKTLLISDKLNSYLADINEQAESMLYRLVKEMTAKENVTEQLKAEQPMLWVQLMNNIHNRAEEVINSEIIYA